MHGGQVEVAFNKMIVPVKTCPAVRAGPGDRTESSAFEIRSVTSIQKFPNLNDPCLTQLIATTSTNLQSLVADWTADDLRLIQRNEVLT